MLPERHVQSPRYGEHGDSFRGTFEEPCDVATQCTMSYEAIMLCPAQGSREATPSSDKETPSVVVTHCTQEGVKGGGKRHRQHLQGTTTMTIHDDDHNWEAGSSSVRRTLADMHIVKCPAMPPIDHFKRLLEEACPNHAYPIRHNLKDYGMMRGFRTSGSLTWGTELNKEPDGSDTTLFPEENINMMIYGDAPCREGAAFLA
jgi:hypothetical protein